MKWSSSSPNRAVSRLRNDVKAGFETAGTRANTDKNWTVLLWVVWLLGSVIPISEWGQSNERVQIKECISLSSPIGRTKSNVILKKQLLLIILSTKKTHLNTFLCSLWAVQRSGDIARVQWWTRDGIGPPDHPQQHRRIIKKPIYIVFFCFNIKLFNGAFNNITNLCWDAKIEKYWRLHSPCIHAFVS